MTLHNPEKISISNEEDKRLSTERLNTVDNDTVDPRSVSMATESFAIPENLQQHFVITPCKLRLVTLAAFVMWKCKVRLDYRLDLNFGRLLRSIDLPSSIEIDRSSIFH